MDVVGVVGGGTMGAGIAEVSASVGCDVVVTEVSEAAVDAAARRIEASLTRGVRSGRLTEADSSAALSRIYLTTNLADLGDCDLIVEAAPEDERLKLDLWSRLDAAAKPDAVLASNTSSIPLSRIAAVTSQPSRVVGMHFFNPVPILPLVEIIDGLLTAEDTASRAVDFAGSRLGKRVIRSKDRAGFVVNFLLVPYLLSGVRLLESGFASAQDIDAGMVAGCAHPMGPLALIDLIGLDTTMAVAESLYAEFKEPLHAPPPLLMRMVEAGQLGRKSGQGFFRYQ